MTSASTMSPDDAMTTDIVEALRSPRLPRLARGARALLAHATKSRLSPAEVVELVTLENRERDARNLAARTKAPRSARSSLSTASTGPSLAPSIARSTSISSPSASSRAGRTSSSAAERRRQEHARQAPRPRALAKGHTVRFSTLAAALADLLKHESIPAIERRLRRYTLPRPPDPRRARLPPLRRARRRPALPHHQPEARAGSTVITTNLSFKQWGTVFGDAPCLGALVDRFAQHCHVIDIDADSWRQRPEPQPQRPTPPARRKKTYSLLSTQERPAHSSRTLFPLYHSS